MYFCDAELYSTSYTISTAFYVFSIVLLSPIYYLD